MTEFSNQVINTLEEDLKNPHSTYYKIFYAMAIQEVQKKDAEAYVQSVVGSVMAGNKNVPIELLVQYRAVLQTAQGTDISISRQTIDDALRQIEKDLAINPRKLEMATQEAEARMKAEAEAKAKVEAEQKARMEEKAKAEEKAREEAEQKAKAQAAMRAREEAAHQAEIKGRAGAEVIISHDHGVIAMENQRTLSPSEREDFDQRKAMIQERFDTFKANLKEKGIDTKNMNIKVDENSVTINIPDRKLFAAFTDESQQKGLLPKTKNADFEKQFEHQKGPINLAPKY